MYNLFSSSPWRLKKYIPVSLHTISKTRQSAQITVVKPGVKHLSTIHTAMQETNILPMKWVEILMLLQETNLPITAHNMIVDAEMKNIDNLILDIQQVRKEWEKIFLKSKEYASGARIPTEYQTTHSVKTQADTDNHYRMNVFFSCSC